jgi:HK97 family phage major capsid protein
MDPKELKDAISNLEKNLEGKSADALKVEVKALKDSIDTEIKSLLEKAGETSQKQIKELRDLSDAQQKHLDNLDVRIKGGVASIDSKADPLVELITKNHEEIGLVAKRKTVYLETKTVGNMTLSASLTGDQPRTFADKVATLPNQILNFHELIGTINIGNGTYTFPRRTTSEPTGALNTVQTEGSDKNQVDYDLSMIDVNTDFIAGFCVYSKKMANNLPFLESFLPGELRRSYFDGENYIFNALLTSGATASTQVITGKNKIEMLLNEIATLEGTNYDVNTIVVTPADYWSILAIEKSTGAGYGLPGIVTLDGGTLRINGIALRRANWVTANKYFVGDFSTMKKVVTEGLSLQFSTEDEDNFRKNNITARIEAQVGLAIHRPDAIIKGDFTAT